jgi:thiol-disulfide isomerase/thioredoxin
MGNWKAIGWTALLLILFWTPKVFGQATQPSPKTTGPIAGRLCDENGKPLPGVKMCLCSRPLYIWSAQLPYDDPANPDGSVFSTTDDSGGFSFPAQQKDCNLLAFTKQGYVIAKSKRFTFPLTVHLTPWATLGGVLKIDGQIGPAGVGISARYENSAITDNLGPYPYFTAQTDEHGRFDFGHVLAGNYSLNREPSGISMSITAPAGQVTDCLLPGVGREVHGRITLPAEVDSQHWHTQLSIVGRIVLPQLMVPNQFLQLTSEQRLAWYNQWETQTDQGRRHVAQRKLADEEKRVAIDVKPDGSFAACDLCVGSHTLIAFFSPIVGGRTDYDHQVTRAYDFDIPAANGAAAMQRLELGDLSPRVAEITNAGQTVPDIAFRSREGADLLLSQFRGKIVFLDFWGVWCGVCQHDLPIIKAIHEAHGGNPHFAMISLSVRDERATWEKFIDANQMTWTQGLLGTSDEAWQAKAFCVAGYPSYWVIGPDGKVLAEGFQSEHLRPILDKALKDLK